jgi:hypothetical protein
VHFHQLRQSKHQLSALFTSVHLLLLRLVLAELLGIAMVINLTLMTLLLILGATLWLAGLESFLQIFQCVFIFIYLILNLISLEFTSW